MDLGAQLVFFPTHEPWRNELIENLNVLVDYLLLRAQYFATERQLLRRAYD